MKDVSKLQQFSTVLYGVYVVLVLLPVALVFAFIATYAPNVPIEDNWWDPVWVAVKARSGALSLEDIFVNVVGHRPVFIRLFAAIWAVLGNYNIGLAKFLGALNAFINLMLLAVIARRLNQRLLPIFMVAASLILFTLHYSVSWMDIYYSTWYQPVTFLLLGITAILYLPPTWPWRALLLAALCAICATFSMGFGLAVWAALSVVIFSQRAYWRIDFILVWIALAVACVGFYNSSWASAAGETSTSINPLKLIVFPYFKSAAYTLAFQTIRFNLGSIFFPTKLFVLVVLVFTAFNSWILWRQEREIPWVWIGCGIYALCGAFVVSLGRGVSLPPRYGVGSDLFWIAVVAIALSAMAAAANPTPLARSKWIIGGNVILLVIVFGLTLYTNIWSVQAQAHETGRGLLQIPAEFPQDRCVRQYPLQRNDCFRGYFFWGHEQSVYHLAALRLSSFARESPQPFLPAEYEADSPVIVVSPNRWLSVYVRDWMLPDLPSDRVYHVAPEVGHWEKPAPPVSPYFMAEVPVALLTQPLENSYVNPEQFFEAVSITTSSPIWVIGTPETAIETVNIDRRLIAAGYESVSVTNRHPRYSEARFTLFCYQRAINGRSCP